MVGLDRYSGQWWESISVFGRIFLLANIIWVLVMLQDAQRERRERKMPGMSSFYSTGDIAASHLPTLIPH